MNKILTILFLLISGGVLGQTIPVTLPFDKGSPNDNSYNVKSANIKGSLHSGLTYHDRDSLVIKYNTTLEVGMLFHVYHPSVPVVDSMYSWTGSAWVPHLYGGAFINNNTSVTPQTAKINITDSIKTTGDIKGHIVESTYNLIADSLLTISTNFINPSNGLLQKFPWHLKTDSANYPGHSQIGGRLALFNGSSETIIFKTGGGGIAAAGQHNDSPSWMVEDFNYTSFPQSLYYLGGRDGSGELGYISNTTNRNYVTHGIPEAKWDSLGFHVVNNLSVGTATLGNNGISTSHLYTTPTTAVVENLSTANLSSTTSAVTIGAFGMSGVSALSATNTQNWTNTAGIIGVNATAQILSGASGTVSNMGSLRTVFNNSSSTATVTNGYELKMAVPSFTGPVTNFSYITTGATQGSGNYFIDASTIPYQSVFGGNITSTSFIKSGGTSAQILAADGSNITAGTNITISGGTISSSAGGITSITAGRGITGGTITTTGTIMLDTIRNYTWGSTGGITKFLSSNVNISGTSTASSGTAVSQNINSTLTQSSGADNLIALDIAPTFQSNSIATLLVNIPGTGYTNGTYTNVPLNSATSGTGALATVIVSGGAVTSATITNGGYGYLQYDYISIPTSNIGGTGSGTAQVRVSTLTMTAAKNIGLRVKGDTYLANNYQSNVIVGYNRSLPSSWGFDGYVRTDNIAFTNDGTTGAITYGSNTETSSFPNVANYISNSSSNYYTIGNIGKPMFKLYGNTGDLTLQNGGTFTDAGYRLDVDGMGRYKGTISAASGAARSLYLNQTLLPNVNGDVLVALDINDTYDNGSTAIATLGSITAGSGYINGTYTNTTLTGGTGTGATANITVSGNVVTVVTKVNSGTGYTAGNTLSASIPGGSGFSIPVSTIGITGVTPLSIRTGNDVSFGGTTITSASNTAKSSLRIPTGTAPTTPIEGDIWKTGTNINAYINSTTQTITTNSNIQSLTNKNITSSTDTIGGVKMSLGSDTSFDMYYRGATGLLTRLPNGTNGQIIVASTGAAPIWFSPTLFTNTNTVSVSNTTTETSIIGTVLGTTTIPIASVGKQFKIMFGGVYSTDVVAPGNLTFNLYYGSTLIATTDITALAAGATNLDINGECILTTLSVGSSGTITTSGGISYETANNTSRDYASLSNNGNSVTVANNSTQTFNATVTWASASALKVYKNIQINVTQLN